MVKYAISVCEDPGLWIQMSETGNSFSSANKMPQKQGGGLC